MDLTTRYLGLTLRNPLLASASPLSTSVDGVRRLADAGVGAVVLYSLFEEQLRREDAHNMRMAAQGSESYAESLTYFPAAVGAAPAADNGGGARRYLRLLERAAAAIDIPVIGSLNASTPGSWAGYARSMQDAGAAAIELNIYYLPGDTGVDGRAVEQRHLDVLAEVKSAAGIPVAVKLSPYFSATADMAHRLDAAGADGLVLFNRFLQPDIDPETLGTVRTVALSTPADTRAAADVDHVAAPADTGLPGRQHRGRDGPRRGQVPARRGRRRPVRVGAAAPRSRVRRRAAAGPGRLDGPQGFSAPRRGAGAAGGAGRRGARVLGRPGTRGLRLDHAKSEQRYLRSVLMQPTGGRTP